MADIENITKYIIEDAQKEAAELLKAAEEQCKEIVEQNKKNIEKLKDSMKKAAELEGKKRAEYILSSYTVEERKARLKAKQEVISNAFDKAMEILQHLSKEQYLQFIEETLSDIDLSGDEELLLSINDKEKLGEDFEEKINSFLKSQGKKNLTVEYSPEEFTGYRLSGDNIEINYTLQALINNLRVDMETEIAEILFS